MKKMLLFLLVIIVAAFIYFWFKSKKEPSVSLNGLPAVKAQPLLAYSFDKLRQTKFPASQIRLGTPLSKTSDSTAQLFDFDTAKKPGSTEMDKVSGVINLPAKPGTYPIIVMLRGFIPDGQYTFGAGTQHVAEEFAGHGFITLAPDFLGFGQSSPPSSDSFEARFQTYTTALTLLSSLSKLNDGLQASYSGSITADLTRIGIWGHSNGGHIAFSTIAISGVKYPTVLWAPVSKSFPYSILYYTDEADDQGKALRGALADFEQTYNADLFSPTNYYQWIKAPISIYQGDTDEEVPEWWSRDLVSTLKKDGINASYHVYHADHNMLPSAWDSAVLDSIAFFDTNFTAK